MGGLMAGAGKLIGDGLKRAAPALKGRFGRAQVAPKKTAIDGACFGAGTLVAGEHGLVAIETIRVGDRVWSRDEDTGRQELKNVTQVFVTPDQPVIRVAVLATEGVWEVLEATPNHRFWVERGWVAAEELLAGNKFLTRNGALATVDTLQPGSDGTTVYNLEVEGFHTYFVGHRSVWVHNNGCAKGFAQEAAAVPGRVGSRINLSNEGMKHVRSTHLNPSRIANKSQFSISEGELRGLLSAKGTVKAPVRALETGNFARTLTADEPIGTLANKLGGGSTNTFTVITDRFGNLESAFPGTL